MSVGAEPVDVIGDTLCRTSFGDFSEPRMRKIAARIVRILHREGFRIEAEAVALDADRLLAAIKGSQNTMAGWLRHMEGYDDEAMKKALLFAYEHPDPRDRLRILHEQRIADDPDHAATCIYVKP